MNEEQPMESSTMVILLVYHLVLGSIAISVVISVWPAVVPAPENQTVRLFLGLLTLRLNSELTLLLVVVFTAIIGSFVHTVGSIGLHKANEDLREGWAVSYATRPFVGAGLALIIYFLLRAVFLNFGADPSMINIYGVAAISGMAGMFTNSITEKVRDLANAL